MRTLTDKIEKVHNKLSDQSWVWFPFVFLKPKVYQKINRERKIMMSFCFGLYFSVVVVLRNFIFLNEFSFIALVEALVLSVGAFYVWFTVVTTYFWNRRAIKIQKKEIK